MRMGRKVTGGRYKSARKKKLFEKRGQSRMVKMADKRTKVMKVRGGYLKLVSLAQNKVNVMVKGKAKVATIKNVVETPSDRFLARQNILVKSAIVETDLGRARITNRPSQEGVVQAVLIEDNGK